MNVKITFVGGNKAHFDVPPEQMYKFFPPLSTDIEIRFINTVQIIRMHNVLLIEYDPRELKEGGG